MNRIETAAGPRAIARSLFPREWGPPPIGDQIELAAWIAVKTRSRPLLPNVEVRADIRRPRRGTDPRQARLELLRREAP